MTARKVVTRSGRKIRGVFPSRKVGKLVEWESMLERDTILLLEFSPGVKNYRQQPQRVDYADGDTLRRYYPDFEVITTCDEIIHLEVKPSSQLAKPDVRHKLRMVAEHYVRQGMEYRILSEDIIRRSPVSQNVTLLRQHFRYDLSLRAIGEALQQQLAQAPRPFDQVAAQIGRHVLLKLIAQGQVACNLTLPFDHSNLIQHPKAIDHEQVLF